MTFFLFSRVWSTLFPTKTRPTLAVLSTELKKGGTINTAPGRLADLWEGDLGDDHVAMKAFRIYSPVLLEEAKEVSTLPV